MFAIDLGLSWQYGKSQNPLNRRVFFLFRRKIRGKVWNLSKLEKGLFYCVENQSFIRSYQSSVRLRACLNFILLENQRFFNLT